MIKKFHVLLRRPDRARQHRARRHAGQRPALLGRAAARGVLHRARRRADDGRARLRRAVDRRAPFPARGLRGLPEPDPARAVARDPDQAAEVRLRASTCCRCGTRSAWPRTTPWPTSSPTAASSWASGAAITPARSRASARRCSTPRRTASCSRSSLQLLLKCFNEQQFHHKGKFYEARRRCEYRGYTLKDITLVPRPKHLPVEIWMPIASGKTIDMMAQYGLKAMVTLNGEKILDDVVRAYHDACAQARPAEAARRGRDLGRRGLSRRQRGRGDARGSSPRMTSATSGSRRSASCATPTSRAAPGARPARRRASRRSPTA